MSGGHVTDPIRLAYDISVLGIGHTNPVARTGIFRATECLATELQKLSSLQLSYTACSSLAQVISSCDYLASPSALLDRSLLAGSGTRSAGHICRLLRGVARVIASGVPAGTYLAAVSRFLSRSAGFIEARFPPLTARELDGFDIFHSTFFALPPRTVTRSLVRFITVYDVLPILHPEWFPGDSLPRHLAQVVSSVQPSDWVLCISQSTKNDLCGISSIDPDRVFVTPLAASSELFRPVEDEALTARVREKYAIPPGPYVLGVNTLEPRKNLPFSIRCFAELIARENPPDLHFVVVGASGWGSEDVLHTVSKYPDVADRIILTGYVPSEDLAPLYSGALMFVYPSLYEGFGLPPLEAMQCGVPVIVSNTSSLPEVVGDAGIMIDPQDSEALVRAMSEVYRSPTLRSELSERARLQAAQFSWQRCAAETVAAYRVGLSV